MNYQKIYDDICKRGQERILPKEVYTEKHHIIPKCMNGTNEKSNLTVLTAREHFLVHYILTRIYPNNSKIWNACFKMCSGGKGQKRFIPNSRLYEFIKIELTKLKSGQTYEQLYGQEHAEKIKQKISKRLTGKIVSEMTRQNMRIARTGFLLGAIHSEEQKQKWSIARSGEGNPMHGKFHTFESLQQMVENNPRRKPCVIEGIEYMSAVDASRQLNISTSQIRRRLKSNKEEWKDWMFINKTEEK